MTNPILKELYDIRREILAEHKDDLADYLRAELAQAKAAGHPIAEIKQRTIRGAGAAKTGDLPVEHLPPPPGDR